MLVRLLIGACVVYAGVVALLFLFQARLIYPAPQDRPALSLGYQDVVLETQDGLTLRAFYREASAEGSPTVVYFHGNGGTLAGATVSNAALADAGLGVLLVEYRGYGANPGQPSEEGLYLDAEAALEWLKSRSIAPSETIVIGNSIGGGVATWAALRMAEGGLPPAGLILVAPFTSLGDAAADQLWWLPAKTLLGARYDNAGRLEKLGGVPVLIQHGTKDSVISDSHGRTLATIGERTEFQSFEGSGHALSFEPRSQAARLAWIRDLRASETRPPKSRPQ